MQVWQAAVLMMGVSIALAAAVFIGLKVWQRRARSRRRMLRSRADGTRIR